MYKTKGISAQTDMDENRVLEQNPSSDGLWKRILAKLDFAAFKPTQAKDVIESKFHSDREGDYYVIKNPDEKRYLKLSEKDYYAWSLMDGTRSVSDLVVAHFMKFGTFAYERIGSLVQQLYEESFLTSKPVHIYEKVRDRIERRKLIYWIRQLKQMFIERSFTIEGIDDILDKVYRNIGWVFFTEWTKLAYCIISIVGTILFLRNLWIHGEGLFQTADSYSLGLLTLFAISIFVMTIHELAHALAVKSYGRQVTRGGFMFYYGMPCFFADTTDIWLEDKGRRIATSWAGPYSEIILASFCSIIISIPILPLSPFLSSLLLKIAFICYLGAFINLNPLLELDGYFMLMDWLEKPLLRKRSLAFIKDYPKVWRKLTSKEGLSREEGIFMTFGVMTIGWTFLAICTSAYIAVSQLRFVIGNLSTSGKLIDKVMGLGILIFFAIPMLLSFLALLFVWGLKGAGYLLRLEMWKRTRNVAIGLLILSISLVLLPHLIASSRDKAIITNYYRILISVGMVICLYLMLFRNRRHVEGSSLAVVFDVMTILIVALLLAVIFKVIPHASIAGDVSEVAALSLLCALCFCFVITHASHGLRWHSVAIPFLSSLVGVLISVWYGSTVLSGTGIDMKYIARLINPGIAVLAMGTGFPILALRWRTDFFLAWIFTLLGVVLASLLMPVLSRNILGRYNLLSLGLQSTGTLFLASGLFLHHIISLRGSRIHIRLPDGELSVQEKIRDRDRLRSVFHAAMNTLLGSFGRYFGHASLDLVEGKINQYASDVLGAEVKVTNGKVENDIHSTNSIIDLGENYQCLLDFAGENIAKIAGNEFVTKLMTNIYDQLYWQEREIADQHIFGNIRWVRGLLERRAMMRKMPIFSSLDDKDLDVLASLFRTENAKRGQAIVSHGEVGDKFFVIQSGIAEVLIEDGVTEGMEVKIAQLGRGDYFGELALLTGERRSVTVRALTDMKLLVLTKEYFDDLAKLCFDRVGNVSDKRGIEYLTVLRRMPLFSELTLAQISLLASKMELQNYNPGETIIQTGEIGTTFYVVKSGEVEVFDDSSHIKRKVAELGPGEFFGEIALLRTVTRTATVKAKTGVEVFALSKKDFDELLSKCIRTSRNLEQVSSRRLYYASRHKSEGADKSKLPHLLPLQRR